MLSRKAILFCLLAAISFTTNRAASAQAVANAQIHGTIQDSTGAVVMGAQVKATQTATEYSQTTVSGSSGNYIFLNLPVGPYRIDVSAPGFKTFTRSGIVLQVADNDLINVALAVGNVSQHVVVSGEAAQVQTQDTSISQVIDQQRIVDLPLNGRQATDLITLSGGAAQPPNAQGRDVTSHDYVNSLAISVSGGQINGNNYLLDGADNNDSHSNINLPFPFPDALQEFSVQTSGISARYGLHPGSVVNVVTKSGTNSFHGDLFEFVRNGDADADNFPATTQDNLRRNQYGGTIGGPIRKNKIFAFGGFQETKIRTAPPNSVAYVATQQVLDGDFSAMESAACQSKGVAGQLINPSTGLPYANNFIPPTSFVTPALNYLKLIPLSTDPCGKLIYSIPNPSNEYQYVSRLDWMLSPKHSVFARYFILDYANPAIYTNNVLTTTRPALYQRSQTIALGDEFTFTQNLINSVHIDFSRLAVTRSNPSTMPSPVGLGVNMYNGSPNYTELSVNGFFSLGGGSNATATFIRNQWQYADDMDWIRGRHHFIFGGEFIANQMDENNVQYENGDFTFNGAATNSALADFLLGSVYQLIDSGPVQIGLREKYYAAYFQDNIQLTKRLNVHAGVRWEPSTPEHDAAGRGNSFQLPAFIAGTKTNVYQNAPPGLLFYGDPGIPRAYANGSWDDFAPRVGLAWDPTGTGKESVRASYGIFFDQPESYTDRDFSLDAPWASEITLTSPAGGFVNPFAAYPGGDPYPLPYPPSSAATFPTGGSYINLPINLHHPYMQQYDLSLERQLGGGWFVTANYIGNKATHFRSGTEENPAEYIPGNSTTSNTAQRRKLYLLNPTAGAYYSTITFMDDGVNTGYNALKLSAQHRLSQKYTVLVSYTWSHALQDTETLANRLTGNQESDPYDRNHDYGPTDFDIRNNLVGSLVYQGFDFADHKVNLIAGGWSPSFLVRYNSGFPFSPTTGTDASLSGVGLDRPNAVAGVSPYVKRRVNWLNPTAFVKNGSGTFGDTGMNSLVGPDYVDADASLAKLFTIHEQQQFELRFEFFNAFNHENFAAPVSALNSSEFGVIEAANPARILQFAGKYTF